MSAQTPFTNITKDFNWESDNALRLFEMTARYGLPHFQSFLNLAQRNRPVPRGGHRQLCPTGLPV